MGDSVPADDQNEPLSVARTLDFSQDNMGSENTAKEAEIQNTQDENGCSGDVASRGDGSGNVLREDESHNDADIKEVDSHSVKESSKKETDSVSGLKADGFQELLQLAQEFESEESSREVGDEASENIQEPLKEKLPKENGVLHSEEPNGSDVKENHLRAEKKSDTKVQKSEATVIKKTGHSVIQAPKARLSSSASLSKSTSKIVARVDADGVSKKKKTPGEVAQAAGADSAPLLPNNRFHRSISIGPSRSNFTVPQPFALATDKRASIGGRPADGEAAVQAHPPPRLSGAYGNSALKNFQVSKKTGSKLVVVKSLHSESMKHLEDSLVKANVPLELKVDDDEVQSVSSVGSKAPRAKGSSVTNASGFNFKCDERAEKRKEFYTKLEEMHIAKEEEKNQMQAKTKEETEAEIKQLRKSLTFKAAPMPSFYHEAAPPKAELKKIPTTRAKSPKFGRRSGSLGLDSERLNSRRSIPSEQEHSSSDSVQKSADENADKVLGKSNTEIFKKSVRRSLSKLTTEKPSKSKLPGSINIPKQDITCSPDLDTASANGSTDSVKVRVTCTMGDVSIRPSDEERGAEQANGPVNEQDGISECENNTSVEREEFGSVHTAEGIESESGPVSGSVDLPVEDGKSKDSDPTSNRAPQKIELSRPKAMLSTDLSNGNKVKTNRALQQVPRDESQDAKSSKTVKRERLKASTPSFRSLRRESVGNGSVKRTMKSDRDMTPVAADVVVHS